MTNFINRVSMTRKLKFTALVLIGIMLSINQIWGAAATVYTSNVTLSSATKDGSTSSSRATNSTASISGTGYTAVKLGSSSNSGYFFISVPANTTTLTLHAAGWNGKSNKITLSKGSSAASTVTISPSTEQNLTANSGVSGSSSTYTITPNNTNEFFTFTLTNVSAATIIRIYCNERCLVWGVNAETATDNTYTLKLPKGDGTYDEYETTDADDLADPDVASLGADCGGEDLNGYFAYKWTTSAIARASASTSDLSDISPKYDDDNPPSTSATLYPLFYDGESGLLHTAPVCVVACTKSVSVSASGSPTNCTSKGA